MQRREGYGSQEWIGIGEWREWPDVPMHDAVQQNVRVGPDRRTQYHGSQCGQTEVSGRSASHRKQRHGRSRDQ
jgi:hypothetical protein